MKSFILFTLFSLQHFDSLSAYSVLPEEEIVTTSTIDYETTTVTPTQIWLYEYFDGLHKLQETRRSADEEDFLTKVHSLIELQKLIYETSDIFHKIMNGVNPDVVVKDSTSEVGA